MNAFHWPSVDRCRCHCNNLICVLILYRTGILRATQRLLKWLPAPPLVWFLLGVGCLSWFGMSGIQNAVWLRTISIGFSLLCVGLAAFNLVIDFHVIEEGAENRAPKRMEWRAVWA